MENDPFIDGLPIKSGDFPVRKLLVYQRVYHLKNPMQIFLSWASNNPGFAEDDMSVTHWKSSTIWGN